MHEGAVSAELGFTGYPSVGGEPDGRARPRARRLRGPAAPPAPPLRARVGRGASRGAREAGVAATAEVTPHHLCLTDEAVRSLDSNVKMNPPLRAAEDRAALIDGAARRHDRVRSRPTTRRTRATRRRCRSRRRRSASPASRRRSRRSTRTSSSRASSRSRRSLERMSAGPARAYGLDAPRVAVGAPREPRPARHERELARRGGRLPLAVGQLVAARRDAHGPGRG